MDVINIVDGLLYQWDTGRKVRIVPPEGISVDEVHFTNNMQDALVVEPYSEDGGLYADIPNILLQDRFDIFAYAVKFVEDDQQTICSRSLHLNERQKPEDYVYTETEVKRYETLEKRIAALESGESGGAGSSLPLVTEEDDGKVLTVVGGKWTAGALPTYSGEYAVTPGTAAQTLETAQKLMKKDLTINAIPYFETGNTAGGSTVYIANTIDQ